MMSAWRRVSFKGLVPRQLYVQGGVSRQAGFSTMGYLEGDNSIIRALTVERNTCSVSNSNLEFLSGNSTQHQIHYSSLFKPDICEIASTRNCALMLLNAIWLFFVLLSNRFVWVPLLISNFNFAKESGFKYYFSRFMVYCIVLYCITLYYIILYYIILYYFILFYFILFYFILYYIVYIRDSDVPGNSSSDVSLFIHDGCMNERDRTIPARFFWFRRPPASDVIENALDASSILNRPIKDHA
jgi:hypothetical protein